MKRFYIAPWVAFTALTVLVATAASAAPLTCAQIHNGACMVADTFSLEFDGMGGSKVLIPSRQGIFVNASEDLCDWSLAKGLPADGHVFQTVTDPLLASRVWALVGAGGIRQLYVSEDQGASFVLRHQFPKDEVWWRLTVLASTPRKVYVSGPGLVGPFAITISNDDGQSFSNLDPVPDLANPSRTSKLETVSNETPPRLYFSRDTALGNDEVWVSQDDGKSVARSLRAPRLHATALP